VRFHAPADPYWDAFINRPPADPNNLITHAFEGVPTGGVHPVRAEVHSPNVQAAHIKELARFFGADRVGIVELASNPFGDADPPGPAFAIVCALRSQHDTRRAPGLGGQAPALKALFVTFNLCAVIREMGYHATLSAADGDPRSAALHGAGRLAALAGVGPHGPRRHLAEVVLTDLPLAADQREVPAAPIASDGGPPPGEPSDRPRGRGS